MVFEVKLYLHEPSNWSGTQLAVVWPQTHDVPNFCDETVASTKVEPGLPLPMTCMRENSHGLKTNDILGKWTA